MNLSLHQSGIGDMKCLLNFLLIALMCLPVSGNNRKMPVMGERVVYDVDVEEISGLCFNADKSALLACGDKGIVKKISFEGVASDVWTNASDMEGITIDPAGNVYIAIERTQNLSALTARGTASGSAVTRILLSFINMRLNSNPGSGMHGLLCRPCLFRRK